MEMFHDSYVIWDSTKSLTAKKLCKGGSIVENTLKSLLVNVPI